MIDLKTIGSNIKKLRTLQKLSQGDLAEKCGFRQTKISRIESGGSDVTFPDLNTISNALNVDFVSLIATEDNEYISVKGEQKKILDGYVSASEKEKQTVKYVLNIVELGENKDEELIELMRVCKIVNKKHRRIILEAVQKAITLSHEDNVTEFKTKLKAFNESGK